MQVYPSSFHATLPETEADYQIHSRDIPTRRDNAHRKSWEIVQATSLNLDASHPSVRSSSCDSYEPNRLGSQS